MRTHEKWLNLYNQIATKWLNQIQLRNIFYRIGVGIEFHLESFLLKPGILPPVSDGGEDLPEEESEEPHTDDTAGNTCVTVFV